MERRRGTPIAGEPIAGMRWSKFDGQGNMTSIPLAAISSREDQQATFAGPATCVQRGILIPPAAEP